MYFIQTISASLNSLYVHGGELMDMKLASFVIRVAIYLDEKETFRRTLAAKEANFLGINS